MSIVSHPTEFSDRQALLADEGSLVVAGTGTIYSCQVPVPMASAGPSDSESRLSHESALASGLLADMT